MHTIKLRTLALFLSLLMIGKAGLAQDDAIGKFFGKYVEDDRFTVVSIEDVPSHGESQVGHGSTRPQANGQQTDKPPDTEHGDDTDGLL
jgi:hypothetical protein